MIHNNLYILEDSNILMENDCYVGMGGDNMACRNGGKFKGCDGCNLYF